jgi:hypothetical protein
VGTKFDHSEGVNDMTKAAIIISAVLVFAGVAAAGSLPGLSGGGSNSPTLSTPGLATTTVEDDGQVGEDISGPCDEAEHANDPRCTGVAPATTTTAGDDDDEAGEDISGPCDEAEHANDPRCTGVAPQAGDDDRADDGDRHGTNRGHGGDDDRGDDHGGNSGRGGGGNSGHDGGGDDD